MTESQRLLECLGHSAMHRLCNEFGGVTLYVPKRVPNPLRDNTIRVRFSESIKRPETTCMSSYRAVAGEFGLSVRRVQEIVAVPVEAI